MQKCLINNLHVNKLNDISWGNIKYRIMTFMIKKYLRNLNEFNLYEDIVKP